MYILHSFICYICIYYVDLSCTNKVTEKYGKFNKIRFQELFKRVNDS